MVRFAKKFGMENRDLILLENHKKTHRAKQRRSAVFYTIGKYVRKQKLN